MAIDRLTDDDAATIQRLAVLTGRTAPEVFARIERSLEDWKLFQVAVSLASNVWDYLDGETGQWTTSDEKQDRQLRAMPPPCSTPANERISPAERADVAFSVCIEYNWHINTSEAGMTTLTIRKVDPGLRERLRVRAARNGHSMEAELRRIISDALSADRENRPNLAESIRQRFAPYGGVELEPHPNVQTPAAPSFE